MSLFDEDYRRKLETLRLVLTRAAGGAFHGLRTFGDRGGAIEFSGHRAYAPGDDTRGLDWAVWARLEKLVMKEFAREEGARVYVLVDASASMDFGAPRKFDCARELAGALAYIALAGDDEVDVGFFGAHLSLRGSALGTGAIHRVLDFLARHTAAGVTDFARLAAEFLTPGRRRGPLIVISDFWDAADPAGALSMAAERGFDVCAVHLLAPEEVSAEDGGWQELADSETGERLSIMLGEEERRAYAEGVAAHGQAIQSACRAGGIRYARCGSDSPLEELLFQVLKRARIVK